jgi:choline-phosphate cytidylyltransferase
MNKTIRIYADGIFDIFHYGHAKMFEQAKMAFPNTYLMVGVCSDEDTQKYKRKPILSWNERCESVRHCKWVDEVVYDAPWIITKEFIDKYNIDYIAHDNTPYPLSSSNNTCIEDVYEEVKKLGIFLATKRTTNISTTDIITRILSDNQNNILIH